MSGAGNTLGRRTRVAQGLPRRGPGGRGVPPARPGPLIARRRRHPWEARRPAPAGPRPRHAPWTKGRDRHEPHPPRTYWLFSFGESKASTGLLLGGRACAQPEEGSVPAYEHAPVMLNQGGAVSPSAQTRPTPPRTFHRLPLHRPAHARSPPWSANDVARTTHNAGPPGNTHPCA